MTSKQLFIAIGEIDDRFIESAHPTPKRRWVPWVAAAACLSIVMVGIGLWQGGLFTKPEPLPEGLGGDDNHFYSYAYNEKLYSLNGELIDRLQQQGINVTKWFRERDKETKSAKYTVASPKHTPSLLKAIEDFDIPRDQLHDRFTKEELDALYSGDPAIITKTFASPYAIVARDRAFAPKFYLNATEEELRLYGITQEMIIQKIPLLRKERVIESIFPYSAYTDVDYTFPYQRKIYSLNILSHLDIEAWAEKTYLESNFQTIPSLLLAIETFDVSKEEFQAANRDLIAYYEQRNEYYFIKNYCFTQEEIDLLYAGEGTAFTHAFASPYAIVVDGKAYPPAEYLGGHPKIPQNLIEQKRALLREHGILQ